MRVFFDKDTKVKELFFEQSEVLEAIRQYCIKLGIEIPKNIRYLDTFDGGNDASEIGIKINFIP